MASMTDRNRVTALMTAIYVSTTTFTITPGTGGGSAFTITPPFLLALLTTNGSNTSNGTEALTSSSPGYVQLSAGGKSVTWSYSAGVITTTNSQSYSATGTWQTITGAEIWDSAGTKLRYLQGALSANVTGVVSGDTVQAATGAITADASAW